MEQTYHSDPVYQAQNIVSVQANCTVDEALDKLKRRAEDTVRSLEDLARAVIQHRSWFS